MLQTLRTRTLEVVVVALLVPAAHARASDDAATWYSRVYRTSAGLPSPVVYAIQEDARGYVWLGTALGLVRFDGAEFVKWSTDGETALPPASVTAFASGRDGSLWIGLSGARGVSRYVGIRQQRLGFGVVENVHGGPPNKALTLA